MGLLGSNGVDAILLTSASTAESLTECLGERATELLANVTLASIGPVTTERARQLGLRIDVTAETYTVNGLIDALEGYYRS